MALYRSDRTASGRPGTEVHVDDHGNWYTKPSKSRANSGRVKPGAGLETGVYFDYNGNFLRQLLLEPATKKHDARYWKEFYKLWTYLAEISGNYYGANIIRDLDAQGFTRNTSYAYIAIPDNKNNSFPVTLSQLRKMVEGQYEQVTVVTSEDLEQFKRVWGRSNPVEFADQLYRIHGKKAAEKWKNLGWIVLERRSVRDDDPYRERTQSRTDTLYVLTEEGRRVLNMNASDLPDYVPAKGKPRPIPQPTESDPDPDTKTVVDSALSEKYTILDNLIGKGFPQAQAAAQAVKDAYSAGGKPTEDQLRSLRNIMYRSNMKAEADQFRVASNSRSVPIMSRSLTAQDRSSIIRLASSLPVGSPERKAILAGLHKSASFSPNAMEALSAPADAGTMRGAKKWMGLLRMVILEVSAGSPERAALIREAKKQMSYAMFLFAQNKGLVAYYKDQKKELESLQDLAQD